MQQQISEVGKRAWRFCRGFDVSRVEDRLDTFSKGIEELKSVVEEVNDGSTSKFVSDAVLELVALRAASLLEEYLEALFYDSILGEHPCQSVGSLLSVSDRTEADLLIYSGGKQRENYLTWLPIDSTLIRAEAYLSDGLPFSWLRNRQVELDALKELSIARNAVAHPSAYAFDQLKTLSGKKGYNVDRPADYLRSIRADSIEILILLTQTEIIARALAQENEPRANVILQPESPFNNGQKARAGKYFCRRCEAEIELEQTSNLPKCSQCSTSNRCAVCGHTRGSNTMWERIVA